MQQHTARTPGTPLSLRLRAWWLVRPHERLLIAAVSVTTRAARLHIRPFLAAARYGGRAALAVSSPGAVRSVARAYVDVPAYRAFLDSAGGLPRRRIGQRAGDWLAQLPTTSKHTYVDGYSIAQRCHHGVLPSHGVEVDESSGSSGRPYQWVRSARELEGVHKTLALMARYLLWRPDRERGIVTLNAFSMGAWSTGVNVSMAMKRVGAVKSCGPDTEKILAALEVFGTDVCYTICGYPPFLQQLVRAAAAAGHDLTKYELVGFVGGEGMGEGLRRDLERSFSAIWSAYGASDLDIGVAAETPFSVWLRQAADRDPKLAEALFGHAGRLPMVFQYDPSCYYIETMDGPNGVELVATVLRDTLTPKLRYTVGDAGGVLDVHEATRLALAHGADPADPSTGVPTRYGRTLDLPLLYVHGRADSTVSFMGANLYPEDIIAGLEDAAADSRLAGRTLGAFCLEMIGDEDVRPCVHVELLDASMPDADDASSITAALVECVRARLAMNSADYRAALLEDPRAAEIQLTLHATGTGPFAGNAGRIKRRYVVASAQ
jgi:phenylacetate-CoA ligase